jgi:DNA-binding LacI/PurR family transcriptional regulator
MVVGIHDGPTHARPTCLALEALRIPAVYVSSRAVDRPVRHVFYDSRDAGYQAALHLIDQGYRELLILWPFQAWWIDERIAGARAAVEEAGLSADALTLFPGECGWAWPDQHVELTAQAARGAFERGLVHSGVILPYDRAAYAFLDVASERGKIAGRDFGLVSFDDHFSARSYGLTSLRPPLEEMGQEAGHILVSALRGESPPLQVRLKSRILARSSSQPNSSLDQL